jgi:hypothetical protein
MRLASGFPFPAICLGSLNLSAQSCQILRQLRASTDAAVGNRDRVALSSVTTEMAVTFGSCGACRRLQESKFLASIGRVEMSSRTKSLYLCKAMNDNVEELLDLRLKMVFFNCAHELRIPKVCKIDKILVNPQCSMSFLKFVAILVSRELPSPA